MNTAPPLLEVDRLTVRLGGRPIVSDLSLVLQPGERVGLSGPSGAGKTTLLRAVARLIDAASGVVRLRGEAPRDEATPGFRRSVVLVPQTPVMVSDTVLENLRLPFAHRSVQASWDYARAVELLRALDLDEGRMEQPARELSVGQLQRVALVRAILIEPAVMLLDEPTSGLDEARVALVEGLLRRVSEEQRVAMAIVSHSSELIGRLCHRRVDVSASLVGQSA